MSRMSMIEQVAQALDRVAEERGTIDWRELARAAITAMREPTNEMVWRAANEKDRGSWWRAMIDAALQEE